MMGAMSSPRRRRTALAVPALLALTLTPVLAACGDDDDPGAPGDASRADFCAVWTQDDEPEPDPADSTRERAETIKNQLADGVADLERVGTPADIPADAREGFEVFVAGLGEVSVADIETSLDTGATDYYGGGIEGDDLDKAGVFTDWADDYCR